MKTQARIQQLQQQLLKDQLDGYFIPASDAHNDEYVPECWQRRTWISGFDGSSGDILVLRDQALLWTDSRYTLQAADQCSDTGMTILKQTKPMMQEVITWINSHPQPYRIAVDAHVIALAQAQQLAVALEDLGGELIAEDSHRVDSLWQDQPKVPSESAIIWDPTEKGESAADKIKRVQTSLAEKNINAFACNQLDAIAWLFNIRGDDIPYNPVCISYALITKDKAIWFVNGTKCDNQLNNYCEKQGITLAAYNQFSKALHSLKGNLGLDLNEASWWMALQTTAATITAIKNPITLMKACKNKAELAGIRQAHIDDALALIQFFHWLENNWRGGINEYQAAEKLKSFREAANNNCGLSFPAISAFGSNGAIVHYCAAKKSAKTIDDSSLYLLDSGGQYQSGTTDVTRVLHLGKPTQQQKNDYTRVLKGHIDLARAVFPAGTTGIALDALARRYLWQAAQNFGHGTGHGVGCYLCVHEGPASISPRGQVPLQPGMVLSNEPGLYRANHYGVRIENVQAVTEHSKNDFGKFYQFDTMTMVPYARNLINENDLDKDQKIWLNHYHQKIYNRLTPSCENNIRYWLENATAPIKVNH